MAAKPILISGWRARMISMKVPLIILIIQGFKLYRNPIRAFSEIKRIIDQRHNVQGAFGIAKFVKSGKQYFWNADYCSYPSNRLNQLIKIEFRRNKKAKINQSDKPPILQTLIWGITNRCPLSCRHCYEWDNTSQADPMTLENLKTVLNIFKVNGIRHLQFSGGEPLARYDDLIDLIKDASATMDCWLLTSGFGLTPEKANDLKDAGLTGVHISLDHWEASFHNDFRNNEKSYTMVMQAVDNCVDVGIIVSLSLCATRDFVTGNNLIKYATLAKNIGASFIRILEPRAVGKFANQQVNLEKQQVQLLSDFAIQMNTDPLYRDFPIISFFGYHQRQLGCFGAGHRYVYTDPNGDVHACPFCRGKMGNLLEESFSTILERVKCVGCHMFDNQLK